MGTRDALLQIQMGTYANGVTCYYTFPYTNNVLIGPTPYVRRVRGGRRRRRRRAPLVSLSSPRQRRGKCGEDIRYARPVETDLSIAPPPLAYPLDRSAKLEFAGRQEGRPEPGPWVFVRAKVPGDFFPERGIFVFFFRRIEPGNRFAIQSRDNLFCSL